jgi:hypothetical protein
MLRITIAAILAAILLGVAIPKAVRGRWILATTASADVAPISEAFMFTSEDPGREDRSRLFEAATFSIGATVTPRLSLDLPKEAATFEPI